MNIEINEEVPSIKDYAYLRNSVNWNIANEAKMKIALESSIYCITVKKGNEIIGMGRIVGDGGYFFVVVDIIVVPEYQRKGIGRIIVNNVVDWMKENCDEESKVWLMATKGREEFYEKFGFFKRPNEFQGCGMEIHLFN